MAELSILIPARNEMFLGRTIDDIFAHAKGDTEVIAVLDGEWPDPPLPDHPRLRVTHSATVIGQRAATNLAASMSRATYVMKLDAHCSVAEGFDVELIAAAKTLGRDVTQIPRMYNLHAFNWRCKVCGEDTYQGPTPTTTCIERPRTEGSTLSDAAKAANCQSRQFERVIVWTHRKHRRSDFWRFDHELHFQYWYEYKSRPEATGDIVDVMSSVGACFFMGRERFLELGGLDEAHGSWGQFGTEIACKSWLSGGRHVVNKRTWFAHLFRTQGGDFSFPYENPGAAVTEARAHSRRLWMDSTWPGATRPLTWLINKFSPVPDWTPDAIARIRPVQRTAMAAAVAPAGQGADGLHADAGGLRPGDVDRGARGDRSTGLVTKGIAYYSDNRGAARVLSTVREQLQRAAAGLPIVSATLGRVDLGTNLVPRACRTCGVIAWDARRPRRCANCGTADGERCTFHTLERGYLTMFRQQLAALEALKTDVAFLCEHDVLYDPSHFAFTPPRDDTFYYNQHTWRVDAGTGRALFYYCNQVSGLCASRALLIDHYQRRVAHVLKHGFERSLGYEPGGNRASCALFGEVPIETWMSGRPNVDIKTEFSLTRGRWSQEEFRNKSTCQGWQEADAVPGWGRTLGRFDDFLADVARGAPKETAA